MSNKIKVSNLIYQSTNNLLFSLARLSSSWTNLPTQFQVGGIVSHIDAAKMTLSGQGLNWTFRFDEDIPDSIFIGAMISFAIGRECFVGRDKDVRVSGDVVFNLWTGEKTANKNSDTKFSIHKKWQDFLVAVAHFFVERGLTPVMTPSLVECPGMEPNLNPFKTEFQHGGFSKSLFLPTSPEIHLKKLLAKGYTDFFEIKTCYRNQEVSPIHEAEFMMLEWYRAFSNLNLIREDLEQLLEYLNESGFILNGNYNIESHSVAELFKKYLEFELHPETSIIELQELAQRFNLHFKLDYSWDDLFHLLFISLIEPKLSSENPSFIHSYPPSQAALARINNEGWAERFELYWRGVEIANAFDELTDPDEQLKRFEKDQESRQKGGGLELPIDQEFIVALKQGVPPTGGIALGLDRLFLAGQQLQALNEFRWFSICDYINESKN